MGIADEPAVYEHYRDVGSDSDETGERFRVVGVDEQVTLLRLTENGKRTATGDLQHVDRERFAAEFSPASNPDPRFGLGEYLGGLSVIGGLALAVYTPEDAVAGALMAVAGLFVLWRRHG